MPKSMRQQTIAHKTRAQKREHQSRSRQHALRLLKDSNMSITSISNSAGVPRSTVSMMKQKMKAGDDESLQLMILTPNKRGRITVLTDEEETMVKERIKIAAPRGFAIDYMGMRSIMSRIAADGRPGWPNGLPSYDTIRAFRARHRDITCRKSESKDHVKIIAETYEHVESFIAALESVEKARPGLLTDANCVWNMDETAVDAIEGNSCKVLSGSDSHRGGFRGVSTSYGISKHVTAVVAVSASGLKAPPFFIVAGKKLSSRWLEPVKGAFRERVSGICSRFTLPHWFPGQGTIKVTENGSMEMSIMTAFIKHLNHYARQFCQERTYLLCLDGHSSRKGIEWIDECMKNNCEAVVSPANTSHFLQACDQTVNKKFQHAVREIRDEFCKLGTVDTRQVNFNLACGVYAYEQITASDIVNSFNVTGVFPFQRQFPLKFKTESDKAKEVAEDKLERVQKAGPGSRMKSVLLRQSEKDTLQKVHHILQTKLDACRQIQQLSILLKNTETTNNILMSAGSGRSSDRSTAKSNNNLRAVMLDPGAPAEWVTVEEVLQRRKEKDLKEQRVRLEKEQNRSRKEIERAESWRGKTWNVSERRKKNSGKKVTKELLNKHRSGKSWPKRQPRRWKCPCEKQLLNEQKRRQRKPVKMSKV